MVDLLSSSKDNSEASSDSALLERLQQGDHLALMALYDCYSECVYSIALRILKHSQDAEEVTQGVFLGLAIRPIAPLPGPIRGWLAVTSRNRAISLLRKRNNDSPADALLMSPSDTPKPTEQRMSGRELVNSLEENKKALLDMVFLEGLTHVEIAAATGEALGTITMRMLCALAAMRKDTSR